MSAIGFDTSNYTASVAWTDGVSDKNIRRLLFVKQGERGIRQSDGVFQHMKLVPQIYKLLLDEIDISGMPSVLLTTSA